MSHEIKHGDNLQIMQGMPTASIDLIATDPPYNSGANYASPDGTVQFTDKFASMDDYLDFMRPILQECHRMLKNTGSLYLIVDASASHYLKVELDRIFGIANFRRHINWECVSGGARTRHPNWFKASYHILYYTKSDKRIYNRQYKSLSPQTLKAFNLIDENGRQYRVHGKERGTYYLDERKGVPLSDSWTDIDVRTFDKTFKYPTAKPVKLLERIIKASSDPGDTVLDPFCGSGTAIVAAKMHGRNGIGIDCNKTAVNIARKRVAEAELSPDAVEARGMPFGLAEED